MAAAQSAMDLLREGTRNIEDDAFPASDSAIRGSVETHEKRVKRSNGDTHTPHCILTFNGGRLQL